MSDAGKEGVEVFARGGLGGDHFDAGLEVGFPADPFEDTESHQAVDDDTFLSVRLSDDFEDGHDGAHVVEVVISGVIVSGFALSDDAQECFAGSSWGGVFEDISKEAAASGPAHGQRYDGAGEDDGVAQGHDAQDVGDGDVFGVAVAVAVVAGGFGFGLGGVWGGVFLAGLSLGRVFGGFLGVDGP